MEVVRFWEEGGMTIPKPYRRHIKVVLAKDKRSVPEITLSYVLLHPHSQTDYHKHDRAELILILAGRGKSICDGVETRVEPDMALWVKPGEMHQLINEGEDMLRLATVFTPGYSAEELLGGIMQAARGK